MIQRILPAVGLVAAEFGSAAAVPAAAAMPAAAAVGAPLPAFVEVVLPEEIDGQHGLAAAPPAPVHAAALGPFHQHRRAATLLLTPPLHLFLIHSFAFTAVGKTPLTTFSGIDHRPSRCSVSRL